MTKTVAMMGTDGGVSFAASGFDRALLEIGQNTGNAMFQFSLWRQILNPKFVVAPGYPAGAIHEMADLLVIPAANQVNPAWDLSVWADFIEACDLPVVCIGLGAQSSLDNDPRLRLKPGTERYIRAVAERTATIGVRGTYTQEVLAHLGITNTVITGCPSQTINAGVKGRNIQAAIDRFGSLETPKVGYVLGTLEEEARATERSLAALMRGLDHELILQTDPRLLGAIFNRAVGEGDGDYVKWIGSIMRPDLPARSFVDYLLTHGRFYSDARTWIDMMRRHDLVVGMRIHGAVAGIQAETLGVCVAFDSRTQELAHAMGYPYIRSDAISEEMSLRDIVAGAVFSTERFDHLRKKNSDMVRSLLGDAGCTLTAG